MTTESDLMRAVCERPFDDSVRLAYADEIEPQEPERAMWIRSHIHGSQITDERVLKVVADYIQKELSIAQPPIQFTWSRGFPSAVSLSMSALLGGECPVRPLYGDNGGYGPHEGCDRCHGSGRTLGLAPALAKWPITSVTLTDREPYVGETKASWYDESQRHESTRSRLSSLPTSLYRHLGEGVGNGPYTSYGRWYDRRESALAALSNACVDLIRSLAEPPLPGIRWELDTDNPAPTHAGTGH